MEKKIQHFFFLFRLKMSWFRKILKAPKAPKAPRASKALKDQKFIFQNKK